MSNFEIRKIIEEANQFKKLGKFKEAEKVYSDSLIHNGSSFDLVYSYALFSKDSKNYTLAKKYAYYALLKKPFKIEFADVNFEKNISAKLKNKIKINNYVEFINSNDVKTISNWIKSNRKDNFF